MKGLDKLLIICVDRDDDIGRKTNIQGPIIGKKNNLNAAAKLALADPEESDANCMFAAVKKYDEVLPQVKELEVVTLTGSPKRGFEADKKINMQLDAVLDQLNPQGIILVTDGADDDQLIPVLQSRLPIVAKQTVIVKQAKEVESAFYTIKEALKDPFVARIVFGLPGLLLLSYFAIYYVATIYSLDYQTIFFQAIAFVLGIYLIAKGTGIEERIARAISALTKPISMDRISFVAYLAVLFVLAFGIISAYSAYYDTLAESGPISAAINAFGQLVAFSAIAAFLFLAGRIIDVIHLKRAYLIGKYLLTAIFVLLTWFIIAAAQAVFAGVADLNVFLLSIAISMIVAVISYRALDVFDVRKKVTELLVGLPVYAVDGKWVGRVEHVDRKKKILSFKTEKGKDATKLEKSDFFVRDGKIFLAK